MLIFNDPPIVLFAVPRTGTTTVQVALAERADIVVGASSIDKHASVRTFERGLIGDLPMDPDLYRRVAILREPIARLRSWYRYRQRTHVVGSDTSTKGLSFSEFIEGVISPYPPAWGQIGDQYSFVTRECGDIGIHHLFCFEKPTIFQSYIKRKLGRIKFKHLNASPKVETELDRKIVKRLKIEREEEFLLYEHLGREGRLNFQF